MTQLNPRIQFTEDFSPLFIPTDPNYNARIMSWYGGRAGIKSWQVARGLLCRAQRKKIKVLCAREYQASIRDSVFSLLKNQAELLGIQGFFNFAQTTVTGANGSSFIFAGLKQNIESKKGIEDVDILWIEEGQSLSQNSLDIIEPTIRKPGSQIIITFNTGSEDDPVYQFVVIGGAGDPDFYVRKVTYLDHPFASEETIKSAERMKKKDPEAYRHIWLGEPWTRSDSQVLNGCWREGIIEIPEDPEEREKAGIDGPYFGSDFGFSVDPATLSKFWIIGRTKSNPGTLYVEKEAYGHGIEIDDYPSFYGQIPEHDGYMIRADNSRPEIISHLKRKGIKITAAKKWKGSVEDGITFLRSFEEIVIHPQCKYTLQEARLWSYKTDKQTGDVLPVLVDDNNHCWDGIRYGLQPLIKPQKEIMMRTT